eukprot:COSAG06_NODE_28407_length_575_cov_0.590336_2_plen_124_part_01
MISPFRTLFVEREQRGGATGAGTPAARIVSVALGIVPTLQTTRLGRVLSDAEVKRHLQQIVSLRATGLQRHCFLCDALCARVAWDLRFVSGHVRVFARLTIFPLCTCGNLMVFARMNRPKFLQA